MTVHNAAGFIQAKFRHRECSAGSSMRTLGEEGPLNRPSWKSPILDLPPMSYFHKPLLPFATQYESDCNAVYAAIRSWWQWHHVHDEI